MRDERSSSLKQKHEKESITVPDVDRAETIDYTVDDEIELNSDSPCVVEGYTRIRRIC